MTKKKDFINKLIPNWEKFVELVATLDHKKVWIFRGQEEDWPLKTSLERCIEKWDIPLHKSSGIENQLIRESRRQYNKEDLQYVEKDTLYCLSVMQHHGAPTRLLDWTYSPFVAAQNAIGNGSKKGVIWCLSAEWCNKSAKKITSNLSIAKRNADKTRNDKSFLPLFMGSKRKKFVFTENAFRLSERLIIQKGLFLCQGDVNVSFENNLKNMPNYYSDKNIFKIKFKMSSEDHWKASDELWKMNVTSSTLFPGLDGFSKSLKERIPNFNDFARRNIGKLNL